MIWLKFIPKCPINNIPVLVQIMAWRLPGDKPWSETMMVRFPTHICVTQPQWVNPGGRALAFPPLWLAVCVRTRHIECDIIQLCHDIISTNHSTDNMSWSNWIMSRYIFNQPQNRWYVAAKFKILPRHNSVELYRDLFQILPRLNLK